MADITEAEQWDTGVYQLETTDPVQGGDDGVDNLPHKALANRTLWLKAQVALKALLGGSATQRFKVAAAVTTDEAVNKQQMDTAIGNVDLSSKANKTEVIGINQTWQNVTASRNLNTNYTNTTGKPIVISLRIAIPNTSSLTHILIDGQDITSTAGYEGGTYPYSIQAIIPNGSIYNINTSTATKQLWMELR